MRSTIRLGRIFGIPVGINYSWFLVIILVTFLLQNQFSLEFPRWSAGQSWLLAGATGLLFFGSVLAHELAHSVMATTRGIPVRGITLFIFGGVSNIAHEARRPWVEFIIAVVGPLLSIALGGVLLGVAFLSYSLNSSIYIVALTLGWTNLALGVFNLLPGFPLDGGRVLRAMVWGVTGNYRLATEIAARIGQGLAILIVVGSTAWFIASDDLIHLWPVFIGAFLFTAASSARRQLQVRERLRDVTVQQVATAGCVTVDGATLMSEVVERYVLGQGQTCFLVSDGVALIGVVHVQTIRSMSKARWGVTTVNQAMTPLDALPKVELTTSVADLLEVFEEEGPPPAILVMSAGHVVGAVTQSDVNRFMRARQDVGM